MTSIHSSYYFAVFVVCATMIYFIYTMITIHRNPEVELSRRSLWRMIIILLFSAIPFVVLTLFRSKLLLVNDFKDAGVVKATVVGIDYEGEGRYMKKYITVQFKLNGEYYKKRRKGTHWNDTIHTSVERGDEIDLRVFLHGKEVGDIALPETSLEQWREHYCYRYLICDMCCIVAAFFLCLTIVIHDEYCTPPILSIKDTIGALLKVSLVFQVVGMAVSWFIADAGVLFFILAVMGVVLFLYLVGMLMKHRQKS